MKTPRFSLLARLGAMLLFSGTGLFATQASAAEATFASQPGSDLGGTYISTGSCSEIDLTRSCLPPIF